MRIDFPLKKFVAVFLLLFCALRLCGQTTLCTWNIRDFGNSKDSAEIAVIAKTIHAYDIVALQEVIAGPGGARAVARLADQLNRLGSRWDYVVSDPTSGQNSYKRERYAFLWKTSAAQKVGDPWLDKNYHTEIDREPFLITFRIEEKEVTLCTFHAITKSMKPETEVKFLKFFPAAYEDLNIVFCGDFNLPQSHTVFNPLKKMGFEPALKNQKTSLRQKCMEDDCLASEFDNVFFNGKDIKPLDAGVNHFYHAFESLGEAIKISDHIPVIFRFEILTQSSSRDANVNPGK